MTRPIDAGGLFQALVFKARGSPAWPAAASLLRLLQVREYRLEAGFGDGVPAVLHHQRAVDGDLHRRHDDCGRGLMDVDHLRVERGRENDLTPLARTCSPFQADGFRLAPDRKQDVFFGLHHPADPLTALHLDLIRIQARELRDGLARE